MGSVHVEVRFQAQARHDSNGPGLLGCCHLANDLERPTDNAQSPEQGGGCRCLPNFKDIWSPPDQLMSGLFLPGGSWLYCFGLPAPGSLSAEPGVTAHIPRRSPTDGAVIPPAFAPLPPRLASWHSSRLARTAVVRSGVSLCPARMDPGSSVRSPPAADATSCPHLGDAQLRLAVPRVLLLRHQSQIGPYVSTLDE